MSTFGRVANHGLVLCVVIMLVLPIHGSFKERYSRERRKIEAEGRQRQADALAKRWNSLAYTKATPEELSGAVLRTVVQGALEVSNHQKTALLRRLVEVFAYLQNPTFEEYYRLKTDGFHWRFEFNETTSRVLGASKMAADGIQNRQPSEIAKLLWEATGELSKSKTPGRLTAVCMDNIAVATSRTNCVEVILQGRVSKGFSVAQGAIDPGFRYGAQMNSSGGTAAKDVYLNLSFFARSNESTNSGPMYISLYWSEPDQNWALSRMFTDVLLEMNLLF